MSNYTKVNVRKDLYELIKVQAAADGRSVTNFIERLLRASVSDLAEQSLADSTDVTNPPNLSPQGNNEGGKHERA